MAFFPLFAFLNAWNKRLEKNDHEYSWKFYFETQEMLEKIEKRYEAGGIGFVFDPMLQICRKSTKNKVLQIPAIFVLLAVSEVLCVF